VAAWKSVNLAGGLDDVDVGLLAQTLIDLYKK
jgi:hypothetical protein